MTMMMAMDEDARPAGQRVLISREVHLGLVDVSDLRIGDVQEAAGLAGARHVHHQRRETVVLANAADRLRPALDVALDLRKDARSCEVVGLFRREMVRPRSMVRPASIMVLTGRNTAKVPELDVLLATKLIWHCMPALAARLERHIAHRPELLGDGDSEAASTSCPRRACRAGP